MTLTPILTASPLIQAHILAALPALLLGPLALFRTRRDRAHKVLGYVWVVSMAALAVTGLFIPSRIPLVLHMGPIHALSFLTLWSLWRAMRAIWRGDIAAHRRTMQQLWFAAIGVTGLFTLAPGRVMHRAVFGAVEPAGWLVIAIGLAALAWLWLRHRPSRGTDARF